MTSKKPYYMPATGGSTPHKCGAGYARMTTGMSQRKMHQGGSTCLPPGRHPRIETAKNENAIIFGGGSTCLPPGRHPRMVGQHKTEWWVNMEQNLHSEQIRRTLLVSGSIPFSEMDDFVLVVEQVREEIKQWIRDKGNDNLKNMAGIQ